MSNQGTGETNSAQSVSSSGRLVETASDKIVKAGELKDEGNAAFKAGNYRTAIKKYHHALMYTKGVTSQGDLSAIPWLQHAMRHVASAEEKTIANDITIVVYNNMAACFLKTEKWEKALEYSNKVLKEQPDNAKALFRRGTAHIHLNHTDEARQDLSHAQKLNPENSNIKRQLALLEKKTKDLEIQEQKLYSTMLGQR